MSIAAGGTLMGPLAENQCSVKTDVRKLAYDTD